LIEDDDPVIAGEGADLVLPVLAVAAPAVQKDEGRVALAANFADEVQPVSGTEGFLDRHGIRLAAHHYSCQAKAGEARRQSGESRVHEQLLLMGLLLALTGQSNRLSFRPSIPRSHLTGQ